MSDRLSLSEIVRGQLLVRRPLSDRSSVKLTRNARGLVQIEVSVATGEVDIETPEEASAKASGLFDSLCERYPYPAATPKGSGDDSGEGEAKDDE